MYSTHFIVNIFFRFNKTFYRKSLRHFDPFGSLPYGIHGREFTMEKQMQFPSRRTEKGKNEIDRGTNQNDRSHVCSTRYFHVTGDQWENWPRQDRRR